MIAQKIIIAARPCERWKISQLEVLSILKYYWDDLTSVCICTEGSHNAIIAQRPLEISAEAKRSCSLFIDLRLDRVRNLKETF